MRWSVEGRSLSTLSAPKDLRAFSLREGKEVRVEARDGRACGETKLYLAQHRIAGFVSADLKRDDGMAEPLQRPQAEARGVAICELAGIQDSHRASVPFFRPWRTRCAGSRRWCASVLVAEPADDMLRPDDSDEPLVRVQHRQASQVVFIEQFSHFATVCVLV